MRGRCVVVDDDEDMQGLLTHMLKAQGFSATACARASDLSRTLADGVPDLILLDVALEASNGLDVMRQLADRGSRTPVIVVSGLQERVLRSAVAVGKEYGVNIRSHLRKPVTARALGHALTAVPELRPETISHEELVLALDRSELFVTYQPKLEVSSGQVTSAEALVRWRHPERGVVSPADFVPLAERTGLGGDLTRFVVEQALTDMAAWNRRGRAISVAVNLPANVLDDRQFPSYVERRLAQRGVSPGQLIFELTESTAISESALAVAALTRLRIAGVGLAVDDFGTGYSSLVELHRLPFNELKIDRRFVSASDQDDDARIILEATASLGRALKLRVVAEGIERESHATLASNAGCHALQGYHIARPMALADFSVWYEGHAAIATIQ